MKLYVLFGQRREYYPGECAPEALECQTEYDRDENPEYLKSKLGMYRDNEDFEALRIVTLHVNQDELMKVLRPKIAELQAVVCKDEN